MLARCVIIEYTYLSLEGVLALIHPPTLINTIHITWRSMVKVTRLSLPCFLENALAFISLVPRLILVKDWATCYSSVTLFTLPVFYLFCCLNQKPLNIYL